MYTDKIIQRRLGVLECMKEGMPTDQIAEEFGVGIRTIQKDVQYIHMVQEKQRKR